MTQVLELDGTPVTNFDNPDRKVKWSKRDIWGNWVYGSLRTIAHLDDSSKKAERRFGHEIEVMQGAYNDDVDLSAGTHDKDAVLDVFIPNVDWKIAQRFLRRLGWAAWWRKPPTFSNHIHMVSLGYTTPVGEYVPGQVADYLAEPPRDGLAGHALDPTWHPDNIRSTYFDFEEWEREMEADMPLDDKDLDKIVRAMRPVINDVVTRALTEIVDDIAQETMQAVMTAKVTADGGNTRQALRRAYLTPDLVREVAAGMQPPVSVKAAPPDET